MTKAPTKLLTRLGRSPTACADALREQLGFAADCVDALAEGDTTDPKWSELRGILLSFASIANEVASIEQSEG